METFCKNTGRTNTTEGHIDAKNPNQNTGKESSRWKLGKEMCGAIGTRRVAIRRECFCTGSEIPFPPNREKPPILRMGAIEKSRRPKPPAAPGIALSLLQEL
jgi:hypothetical protein